MATPIPNDTFVGLFRSEGISKIREHPGWTSHNRGNRGSGWGPINGVVIHHTGSDTTGDGQSYNDNILWKGYTGLPGPLCHVGIAPDGTLHVNSNGRANHAGGGDAAVLTDVVNEAAWLMTREAKPTRGNSNGVDGNSRFYGAEIMYSGGHAMTAAQMDTAVRFAAAICRHYGWSARSVIGHREWSDDKVDPGYCPMTAFRAAVQTRLGVTPVKGTDAGASGAGGLGGGGPVATNNDDDIWEELMAMDPKQLEEMFERAVQHGTFNAGRDLLAGKYGSGIPNPMGPDYKGPKKWSLGAVISYGASWLREIKNGASK